MGKIAIFDSGVGGITVLEELYKLMPNEEYIYLGDSAYAPYGNKTNEELEIRVYKIIDRICTIDTKILVIACNTITSFMYKKLVDMLDIPVVGVIFPTVSYINTLPFKDVGVFATSKTIENRTYEKMIERNVFSLATPQFVPMIEDNSYINKTEEIKEILQPLIDKHVQLLVMGCTHYPFIKQQIESFFDGIIVDSSFVTALEVKEVLGENSNCGKGNVEIIVTGDSVSFEKIICNYVSFKYKLMQEEI